jgi:hypothetical protein
MPSGINNNATPIGMIALKGAGGAIAEAPPPRVERGRKM